jgi:hypothetical protein
MKTYRGGTRVAPGFYFDLGKWTLTTISDAPGDLPGGEETRYRRVPAVVLLGLAPVLGAAYVMFLPCLGFALLFGFVGAKGLTVVRKAATTARGLAWKRAA